PLVASPACNRAVIRPFRERCLDTPYVTVHNFRMDVTGHTSGSGLMAPRAAPGAQPRPASIRDVAAAAAVSYQTVSRVINNHPSVRPATRERVLSVISDLGYRPNRAARTLAG